MDALDVVYLATLALVAPLLGVVARKEEEHLVRVLGEAYEAYADEVGRWWPRRLTRRSGRR